MSNESINYELLNYPSTYRNKIMKKLLRNKWTWIIVSIIIVIVLGLGLMARNAANAVVAQLNDGDVVTAFIGDLSSSATASGQVVAQRDAQLSLTTSGTVAEVLVEVGDAVNAGDVLLVLDTAVLQRAVTEAEQNLAIAENNLASLLAGATEADILAAQANVASAQAQLDDLLDGPSETEIAAAEANLRAANADVAAASARLNDQTSGPTAEELRAAELQLELAQTNATTAAQEHSTVLVTEPGGFITEEMLETMELAARQTAVQANADLAAAQENYNSVVNGSGSSIAGSQASVSQAAANRDIAQIRLDQLLAGPTETEIAAAEATLAQAEAALDQLLRGPSDAQIAAAEVQVEQARIALQRAQNNLEKAALTAPFAGVITAVNINQGEQTSGILIQIVDTNSLEVVLDVDEVDIGSISLGQPATITLESWPNEEIQAEVIAIAPRQKLNQANALVTYEVNLSLGDTDLPVLVGMTANADLITAEKEDVLLVPNRAITANRQAGTYTVNLYKEGAPPETVEVTIGLRDSQYTEITSGIEEGMELLIGNNLPTFNFGPPEESE